MTEKSKKRPRRLRDSQQIRALVRETSLAPSNLVAPLFVVEGTKVRTPIAAMPGIDQFSVDLATEEAKRLFDLGVGGVILFGIPKVKDAKASQAWAEDGIVQRALRALTKTVPGLYRIADVCLCEYMDHGHCGVVGDKKKVLNDESLELLARCAVSQAKAGAQMVAPSDMMDHRIGAIRAALDDERLMEIAILSYAVKYASAFYGPFREAALSAPQFGDRKTYQMDPANRREALREARLDVEEGADLLMVKPAGYYLDVVSDLVREFELPVGAYQVSGEYSMIKAAAKAGWIDEEAVMMESLLSIKRSGASFMLTYFAAQAARILGGT